MTLGGRHEQTVAFVMGTMKEINQKSIQVNQKLQEVERGLDNLEGKLPASGPTHSSKPYPMATKPQK